MSKTIEEILEPKPEARPRIYACATGGGGKARGQTDRADCKCRRSFDSNPVGWDGKNC